MQTHGHPEWELVARLWVVVATVPEELAAQNCMQLKNCKSRVLGSVVKDWAEMWRFLLYNSQMVE